MSAGPAVPVERLNLRLPALEEEDRDGVAEFEEERLSAFFVLLGVDEAPALAAGAADTDVPIEPQIAGCRAWPSAGMAG